MERDSERVQGAGFRRALATGRAIVEAFDPDLVVLFGGDHRRAFTHVVPSFAVVLSADVLAEGGHRGGALDIPVAAARELAEHLLDSGIDVTVCRDVTLDHAFAQPMRELLGGLGARPVIPVPINCVTAPLPRAARVLALGDAVGGWLAGRAEKVLVIGTGGLSHSPPSLEVDAWRLDADERLRLNREGAAAAAGAIRPDWDAAFLDALGRWDRAGLAELAGHAQARAGAGANEVRTWLAAGAAGGGIPLRTLGYQPVREWITGMAVATSAPPGGR
jgi:2,3-dihydroxyphenylpropionate 1,2-dioxygenase